MKRTLIPLLVLAVSGFAAATATAAKTGTTIKLEKTNRGMLLTNARGFTLYMFVRDHRNQDVCVKIQGCIQSWPAVTTSAKPVAAAGLKASLLGTIKLPNGKQQVTYNGHPLYTYVADGFPRETDNIGVNQSGGRWYALNAAGGLVK